MSPATNAMMPARPASSSSLTPEIVQQMIVNAFSVLGLSGKSKMSNSTWYMDSGASNHMTHSSENLSHLKPYDGSLRINTADGGSIHITAVGKISHPLPLSHVFLSPQLSTNLLSVGQLVDNHCSVSFSRSGCVVQDQASGKEIAKVWPSFSANAIYTG